MLCCGRRSGAGAWVTQPARVTREHGFERAAERIGGLVETLIRRPPGSAGVLPAQALDAGPRGLEARAPGNSCSCESDAPGNRLDPV